MKNFIYGLAVAAIALTTSAFTSIPDQTVGKSTRVGAITANYLVQPAVGSFKQFPMGTPEGGSCFLDSQRQCFYSVTLEGKNNIPDLLTYNTSQIDAYVANGWIEPGSGSVNHSLYSVE